MPSVTWTLGRVQIWEYKACPSSPSPMRRICVCCVGDVAEAMLKLVSELRRSRLYEAGCRAVRKEEFNLVRLW